MPEPLFIHAEEALARVISNSVMETFAGSRAEADREGAHVARDILAAFPGLAGVIDGTNWVPQRMVASHNGDQGWLVVTHYPRAIIYGVALDERKGTRFHTRADWLAAHEGALQAGLTVPKLRTADRMDL